MQGRKVWVAGHRGMVGAAVVRRLVQEECEILTVNHDQLDLLRQNEVEAWMAMHRPDVVVVAAAKVGGILANHDYPADYLYENLAIETNIIHAAHQISVRKLLFLASSCIYPRLAPQPMREDALLTGPLEPTNEWFAVAKIAGIKLCQAYRRQHGRDFIVAMPANLFGPGDKFDLKAGHVVAAMIMKAHQARITGAETLKIWGSGTPLREFLFVDDLADALVFLLKNYSDEPHINVGSGVEHSIHQLAQAVANVAGFTGKIVYDRSKPDGTPRKIMDSSWLQGLGWHAKTSFQDGLRIAYQWYIDHQI